MASQIGVNVYAIDGIPQPTLSGLQISLPTKEIFIQEYEAQSNPNVHALVTGYPNPNSRSKTQEFQVWETVSALEDLANTSGNSMFGADIYSINLNPLKNGAKRFLFPNDKPSIWPYEDGNVHSYVTFKGNDYYSNQTKTELEDAANEGGGGGSSYLVYTANVRQLSTTGNIIPTELENTIGSVTWSRWGIGRYRITSSGLFTVGRTFLPNFGVPTGNGFGAGLTIYGGSQLPFGNLEADLEDSSNIAFYARWNNFPTDGSAFADDIFEQLGANGALPIEIRVYP